MRVFLSYSGDDRDLASQVELMAESALERCGLSAEIYRAPGKNVVGDDWEQEMAQRLRACDVVVVLWNGSKKESFGRALEVGAAWILGKPLLTVMINSDCNDLPDPVLRRRQAVGWLDFKMEFERFAWKWRNNGRNEG